MKKITIRSVSDKPGLTTKAILTQVLELSPQKPIRIQEMRHRIAVQDALEGATDHALLEDTDWKVLCDAIESFPWSQANHGLLQILDDVLGAETVDKTKLKLADTKR